MKITNTVLTLLSLMNLTSSQGPCKSGVYNMDANRIISSKLYNGDYNMYDFIVDGDYQVINNQLVLKMSQPNMGSTVHSTRVVSFGKISAVMKSSRTGGVVSSFITMAQDKDEIDFEFVGSRTDQLQTNFFLKGVFPDFMNSKATTVQTPDTFNTFNTYTLDWKSNGISWLVNGNIIRRYGTEMGPIPTSPATVNLGIWDGGSNAEGTRQWAGGFIDWNAQDMKTDGYFSVKVAQIIIECYS